MKFAQRSHWLNRNVACWRGVMRVHGTDDYGNMHGVVKSYEWQSVARPYGFEIADYGH